MNSLLAARPALRLARISRSTAPKRCLQRVSPRSTPRAFLSTTCARKQDKPTSSSTVLSDHEVSLRAQSGGRLGVAPAAPDALEMTSFFKLWHSQEVKDVLSEQDHSYVDYAVTALASEEGRQFLEGLNPKRSQEFKDIWGVFSESDHEEYLDDLISFMLKHGFRLLPPTRSNYDPSTSLVALTKAEQQIVKATYDAPENYLPEASKYPNLMTPSQVLDPHEVLELPPSKDSPFHNRVIVRNHRSVFHEYPETLPEIFNTELIEERAERNQANTAVTEESSDDNQFKTLPVDMRYYQGLSHSILMRRTVVQQTGKGKIRRLAYMVLLGDGNGMVGYGEGKHANPTVALQAARLAAARNMDYVYRFEDRTIWSEMKTKLGSTEIILRPRPVGFGLRCNPHLHKILRAAGLKDISAKVWGSRNKLNVIKAAMRLLHSGHAPTGMGDGIGGKGQKLAKGRGMQNKAEVERARGRKLVSLRK